MNDSYSLAAKLDVGPGLGFRSALAARDATHSRERKANKVTDNQINSANLTLQRLLTHAPCAHYRVLHGDVVRDINGNNPSSICVNHMRYAKLRMGVYRKYCLPSHIYRRHIVAVSRPQLSRTAVYRCIPILV